MTDLIAYLSTGKGTWGHVNRLIQDQNWNKIYIITNNFGKENFHPEKEVEMIVIDSNQGIKEIRDQIQNELKDKVQGDVAVNIISGIGKEHTALLGALIKLGIGIRFVALTKEGVEEI